MVISLQALGGLLRKIVAIHSCRIILLTLTAFIWITARTDAQSLLICRGVNVLSVMASFFMVRSVFFTYFREKYGEKRYRRVNKKITKYGLWTVVFSCSIYIMPTNLINFSFPLSSITNRSYLLGTLIGIVPECLINVLTGYLIKHEVILLSSPESHMWQLLIVGGFIVLLFLIFIVLRMKQIRSKKLRTLKGIPLKG